MNISIKQGLILSGIYLCFGITYLEGQQISIKAPSQATLFWNHLENLCGLAYEGNVASAPANDTVFADKDLIMHVMKCNEHQIKIPFFVGDDLSRTWILTKYDDRIELKHDHRHHDGTPDKITMYGGSTSNQGSEFVQFFPADMETVSLLPAAAGNVWWIEIKPGESFTYNLRRLGTDRFFSVSFNLKSAIENNKKPWGWE